MLFILQEVTAGGKRRLVLKITCEVGGGEQQYSLGLCMTVQL